MTDNNVLFLGDSITAHGDWQTWFPDVNTLNFGVGGDTTDDIIARLDVDARVVFWTNNFDIDSVTSGHPYTCNGAIAGQRRRVPIGRSLTLHAHAHAHESDRERERSGRPRSRS